MAILLVAWALMILYAYPGQMTLDSYDHLVLPAFWINGALTDRQMHYWHSSLAIFDIAGTLASVEDETRGYRWPSGDCRSTVNTTVAVAARPAHTGVCRGEQV